jgi:hypothetical protein
LGAVGGTAVEIAGCGDPDRRLVWAAVGLHQLLPFPLPVAGKRPEFAGLCYRRPLKFPA